MAGFSVFQPALGTTLQWLPALGTHELDDMINAFLPGPASIQDKRAHISMDFYEYSRRTGETFKYYPVYTASFTSTTTDSPTTSSAMYDSGYGSSFNMSPAVSNVSPWTPSLSACTPASTASDSTTRSRSSAAKKSTSSSSSAPVDFSSHPGMRILTKDGRDITNSASRGCKSKEQRDHAHLMRIIKACDACRRKKVRCDPSHKKRAASQTQPSQSGSKRTTKAKTTPQESQARGFSPVAPGSLAAGESFVMESTPWGPFDDFNETPDDFWQQFVQFEDPANSSLDGYDFFADPSGYISSNTGSSSASPSQSLLPSTPAPGNYSILPGLADQEPALPYLNPESSYGSNYQDFNLYSPASDFLDEEPQYAKKPRVTSSCETQDQYQQASYYQQTTHNLPYIKGVTETSSSLGTNRSDGALVDMDNSSGWPGSTDRSFNEGHSHLPSAFGNGREAIAVAAQQSRPRPSPSLSIRPQPSASRALSSLEDIALLRSHAEGSVPGQLSRPALSSVQGSLPGVLSSRTRTSTSSQVEPTPASLTESLCARHVGTGGLEGTSPTVTATNSYVGLVRSPSRSTHLVRPSTSYRGQTAEGPLSTPPSGEVSPTPSRVHSQRMAYVPSYGSPLRLSDGCHVELTARPGVHTPTVAVSLEYGSFVNQEVCDDKSWCQFKDLRDGHGRSLKALLSGLKQTPNACLSALLACTLLPSPFRWPVLLCVLTYQFRKSLEELSVPFPLRQLIALGLMSFAMGVHLRSANLAWPLGMLFAFWLAAYSFVSSGNKRAVEAEACSAGREKSISRSISPNPVDHVKSNAQWRFNSVDDLRCALARPVKGTRRSLRSMVAMSLTM